jgi:hypothetical protein
LPSSSLVIQTSSRRSLAPHLDRVGTTAPGLLDDLHGVAGRAWRRVVS